MAGYSKYGQFDTPIQTEGDTGFIRMNTRLRPDQLKPTDVAYSSNGRMDVDGAWQTRNGIDSFGSAITTNNASLTIPFIVGGPKNAEVDSAFGFGTGTTSYITVLCSRINLIAGEYVVISGTTPVGHSVSINGTWLVFSVINENQFVIPVNGLTLDLDYDWTGGSITTTYPIAISSASRSSSTITVNTTYYHGMTQSQIVNISGLTGSVDPNGNRYVTITSANSFTFTITGSTGTETYSGTGVIYAAKLTDKTLVGVYGSCIFSNPNTANDNYILLATNINVQAVSLATGQSTTIDYPSGIVISTDVEMLQAFDNVFIFRGGQQALKWNGSFSGTPAFTAVTGGTYTNPVYLDSSNNTLIADGICTVTEANHGLSVGDRIYVVDKGIGNLVEDGDGYVIATVPTSGTFTFFTQTPDDATHKVVYAKRQSQGLGLMHMPGPAWGVHHQRRLWVPYTYEPAGSSGSPTYTARNILDEIVASDILDSNTYDKIQSQYRISGGTADSLVGVEPFAEDNLLVFMRHSIHLIKGISGSLLDTSVNLITKEVGCVARKSIVQIGNQVLFLSDNGVYAAAFGDLYNLRGAGLPLSEPINSIISRINRNYAQNSVAAYYNNRYYIAVPLDNSVTNNAILVYNLLNQGWESVDTVDSSAWSIKHLHVSDTGGFSKLYVVGENGAIHIIDGRVDGFDRLALFSGVSATTYPVSSYLKTRQYTMGTLERKKYRSYELQIESSQSESSNATISFECENLDSDEILGTVYGMLGNTNLAVGEDASLRGRIGNKRGYAGQVTITPTVGRPKVRAITVSAAVTNLGLTQAT